MVCYCDFFLLALYHGLSVIITHCWYIPFILWLPRIHYYIIHDNVIIISVPEGCWQAICLNLINK